jgi:hypothetical protein
MKLTEAQARIADIRANDGNTTTEELDTLWATLEPVRAENILGAWKGSEFVTGHPAEGKLALAGWYGKTFNSLTDAAPLVCRDTDGNLFANSEMAKGGASLWMVEFRGESTATMVYDGQPIFDHFKTIDDSTLLGVMNGKGVVADGRHYYFVLERD